MGFPSQSGQVILRSQSVAGTYQADTGTLGLAIRTRGGALEPNRDLLIPDSEIGGSRDISDAYLGAVSFSGSLDFYARMKEMAAFLKWALGSSSLATVTGVTTHTATPADTLPWISVEQAISTSLEVYRYTDAKVNTFHLEADANGYLMGTIGLVAKSQLAGATKTAVPVYDTSPLTVGTNITVTYNGVTLPAKSFSFDVNNNLEDDDFRLGSLTLGDVTEKRREVTMGVSIRPADSSLWRAATYGGSALTSPGGTTNRQQTIITMTTYETISGSTPTTAYSCTITVPQSIIRPYALSPSGDDVIENDLEIQAIQPNPATPILTAVTKNDLILLP